MTGVQTCALPIYVKGGSSDVFVDSNEIDHCGTGGFTAGQGTGLEFMVPPHVTYEAENVTVQGNNIHDTEGAGLGVNGGLNVTMSGNTLTRVGSRSHVIEVGFGARGCDGNRSACASLLAQSAWGTTALDDGVNYIRIPDHNVLIENNVIDNSTGSESAWQQLFVPGPWTGQQSGSTANPRPAFADDGLVIRNNRVTADAGLLRVLDRAGLRDYARLTCRVGVTTSTDLANPLPDESVGAMRAATAEDDFPLRLVPALRARDYSVADGIARIAALKRQNSDKLF